MPVHRDVCVVRHGYYPEDPRVFKEVRALNERGFSVDVVCLGKKDEARRETVEDVRVFRLAHQHQRASLLRYLYEYALSFIKMFGLITHLFFRHRYRCIQVNTLPDVLIFVAVIPRIFGTKVLLDMHEPTPELFVTKYGPDRYRFIRRLIVLMEQISIKFAHHVLTVNEALRDRFIERGAVGEKITVIRNVPEEDVQPDGTGRTSNGAFNLLTHGTIVERYGQEVIVRALPLLRESINNLHFTIVGDGENIEAVRALAKELGCSDIVTFTGRVPFSQIGEFIAAADVGIVPLLISPFAQLCQPNKLFEYVAHRKPVIVSRLRAIEESFDESCVLFFEPGNHEDLARCVLELYGDKEKQKKLTDNAYKRYEKLRWGMARKIYVQVITELIGAQN